MPEQSVDEAAWKHGKAARGQTLANPYVVGSRAHKSWYAGWRAGNRVPELRMVKNPHMPRVSLMQLLAAFGLGVREFDSMEDLIADLRKPDAKDAPEEIIEIDEDGTVHVVKTDNVGPESATESPKPRPEFRCSPERLERLERIAAAAVTFRREFTNDWAEIHDQPCSLAARQAYNQLCKALSTTERDMTTMRPSTSEIEDRARAAADATAERSEKLDQQEADLSGKIEDMEHQISDMLVENEKLHAKLERWNTVEYEGITHIKAALDDIRKFLDTVKTSPGWI